MERIDEQHKMLFRMSEDFRAAFDEGRGARIYANLLESLDLYTRSHFGFEERCMAACQCPVARRNSTAHARFIEMVGEFHERHGAHGYDVRDARDLVDFVDRWLSGHIAGIDIELRDSAARLPAGWYAPPA